ncbi:MAG: lipoprotein-releasing ABC transporter permease subunit [Gammaproteobacteria bacterium]|nr:lipoprotein-releasing ABC transporter permease subunit [Gammaproteobacteria bacterium]
MKLPLSVLIGLRYSKSAKDGKFISFISFFSMAGIALGVMSLIIVLSVMDGFEGVLKQRILGAVPHLTLQPKDESSQISASQTQQLIRDIDRENDVIQYIPLVQSQAIVQLFGDLKGMLAQGISDPSSIPLGVEQNLVQGTWSEFLDTKYSVVVGRYLAMEYGLSVGDRIRLMISGTSHYTPIGRMPAQRTFTITGLFETQSEIDSHLLFVQARDLNRLMKKRSDAQDGMRLVLRDAFDAQPIQKQLQSLESVKDNYLVTSWHTTHGKLFDAVKMEKNMMWFMLSLIIAVAAFNIVSALVMMVTKKQGEVAILKTLGMQPATVRRIFVVQGGYNGIFGALVGGVLGTVTVLSLNDLMRVTGLNILGVPGVGLPMELSMLKVTSIVAFAVALALLASVYPAKKASQLMPADVLKHE